MMTFILIFLGIYFMPTLIALVNRHTHLSHIAITNLFMGWSIIFWVFSFRMAMGWDKVVKAPENTN
jgi:hypothetical protein